MSFTNIKILKLCQKKILLYSQVQGHKDVSFPVHSNDCTGYYNDKIILDKYYFKNIQAKVLFIW